MIRGSRLSASPALWGIYLAVSWTWCIGIFLPVMLVRDYGIAGWIAFAIPNVIGAALVGWIVGDGDHVRNLLAAHGRMLVLFSLVTIAFQMFFISWFSGKLLSLTAVVACIFVAGAARVAGERRPIADRFVAAGAFLLSCIVLLLLAAHMFRDATGVESWNYFAAHALVAPRLSGLSGLAFACLFGFSLCPYLDLTFLESRAELTPQSARRAFGWGFGVFFLLMIVLSLVYAPLAAAGVAGKTLSPFVIGLLAIHIVTQLALTTAFHARAAATHLHQRGSGLVMTSIAAGCALGTAALAIGRAHGGTFTIAGLDPGEFVYRGFMGFYGLVFPAYVWICMAGSLRRPQPPGTARLILTLAALLIAAPFFAAAFLFGRMNWIFPGVAVVLAAGPLAWRKRFDCPIIPPADV